MDEPEEEAEIAPEESSTPSPPSSVVYHPIIQLILHHFSNRMSWSNILTLLHVLLQPRLQTLCLCKVRTAVSPHFRQSRILHPSQLPSTNGSSLESLSRPNVMLKVENMNILSMHGIALYILPGAVNEGTTFTITPQLVLSSTQRTPFQFPQYSWCKSTSAIVKLF